MTARLKLEVFSSEAPPETVVMPAAELEEARLASYEQGYTAGWDDATAAQKEDQAALGADVGRNLQTLSFTYHEARMHILTALRPLLTLLVTRVLPEMAHDGLARTVVDQLDAFGTELAASPLVLELNPAARPAVERLLDGRSTLPIRIVEEPSLGEGQAYLRLGQMETLVDLDRVAEEIRTAVTGFFQLAEETTADG